MENTLQEERAITFVLEFARTEENILAVYAGRSPESDERVYYFLTGSKKEGFTFEERISELRRKIARDSKEKCYLANFQVIPEIAGEYGFLEKKVWERNIA